MYAYVLDLKCFVLQSWGKIPSSLSYKRSVTLGLKLFPSVSPKLSLFFY